MQKEAFLVLGGLSKLGKGDRFVKVLQTFGEPTSLCDIMSIYTSVIRWNLIYHCKRLQIIGKNIK